MTAGKKKRRGKGLPLLLLCIPAAFLLTYGALRLERAFREGGDKETPSPSQNGEDGGNDGSTEQDDTDSAYEKQAKQTLAGMTMEEKVGQMFFIRCPAEVAAETVHEYAPGGFILFANDFADKTTAEVTGTIAGYQKASKIPLLVGVDEEGGSVVRISQNPRLAARKFSSPQELYLEGGLDAILSDTAEKAQLLKKLELNVNLAPVADVSTDPADYIYKRAFGRGAAETAEYVAAVVEEMGRQGLSCTLKHFPGYGNNADTHTGIAVDKRPYLTFETSDLLPFEAGISAGAESILVSHNIVECMDPSLPASLSPKVHAILRGKLMFTGVVMTDDLSMDAIKLYTGGKDPSVLAVKAGNDLLVETDFEAGYRAVLAAVKSGEISEARIDDSVLRILKWKYKAGLFA